METMGNRLKRLRVENHLTQEDVGKIIGVQKAAVNKYEKGNVENIKRESVIKLAHLYKVNPSYILCFNEPSEAAYWAYRRLDEEDQSEIYDKINRMLKSEKYAIEEN